MAEIQMEVEGLKEAHNRMLEVATAVQGRQLKEAVEPAAETLREEMSRRAPRDTGRLADNIIKKVFTKLEKRLNIAESRGVSFGGGGASDDTLIMFHVGPAEDVFYGQFHEFGWTDRAGVFHPPDPWMRPAFETKKHIMQRQIWAGLSRRIHEVAA